jgi:glycosyltransferase involved in cell wall biosynthesis
MKKRILIITREIVPFRYGGIGTQFKSLATFLDKRGHTLAFLTEKPVSFSQRTFQDCYGDVGIYFVEQPSNGPAAFKALRYVESVLKAFDRLYETWRPDFVISADFEAEGFLLFLKAGTGCYGNTRFILTLNGMTYNVLSVYEGDCQQSDTSLLDQPHIRLISAMEDLSLFLADEVVSPSRIVWADICRRLGIDRMVRSIPNFGDELFFQYPIRARDETKKANSPILFVGRLDRIKGPDILLNAYINLSDEFDKYLPDLLLIGRDCHWSAYGCSFIEYWEPRIPAALKAKIHFMGQVGHHRVADYIRQAALCVFPSRWEAFGIVCLEAMGMGCPVLIPRGTGLGEMLGSSFPPGLFSHDNDGQDFKERLRLLLDNPPTIEARRALRQRALQLRQETARNWITLIEDHPGSRDQGEAGPKWSNAVFTLLSLLRSQKDEAPDHLKIYFSCKQRYDESNSVRIVYHRDRWATLSIPLPRGTGDQGLRMDPSECPGTVILRQVLLTDQQGEEIWRSDASNRFRGIRFIGKGEVFLRSDDYVLNAADNDPQLLLDCPAVEKPVLMTVVLYAEGGVDATVS